MIYIAGYAAGHLRARYSHNAVEESENHRQTASAAIKRCEKNIVPVDKAECINKATEAYHENNRREKEVKSQVESANWAFYTVVITVIQIPISVIGIAALIVTIQQSKRSIAISQMNYESLIEIEIGFVIPTLRNFRYTDQSVKFDVCGTNIGRSSCYVGTVSAMLFNDRQRAGTNVFFARFGNVVIPPDETKILTEMSYHWSDIKNAAYLHGGINYDTVKFSSEHSPFVFELMSGPVGGNNPAYIDWTRKSKSRREKKT